MKNILKENRYINLKSLDENENKDLIKIHNKKFIKQKLKELDDYFNHIYDDINKEVILDQEQRIAILTDEDYNLIIAGAGSGKTTTMIGKIKYLIEKCNVDSKEILAISFAKKNVAELDDKLNNLLNLNVDVTTFHKLGLTIINENSEIKKNIITDSKKYQIFNNYFKEYLYDDKEALHEMVEFLNYYFDLGSDMENFSTISDYFNHVNTNFKDSMKNNFEKYNSNVIEKRSNYKRTINNEYTRSNEELKIANFLFLNNIEYEYEKRYLYSSKNERVYTPDFTIKQGENEIYLEHFGISENGTSNYYTANDLNKYTDTIKLKQNIHKLNATKLLMTFSKYNDGKPLLDHLKVILKKEGFVLKPKTDEEIFDVLRTTDNNNYFYLYIVKATEFISKMKLNKIKINDLNKYIQDCPKRTANFIKTIIPLYNYYQDVLEGENSIDFEDMIVNATDIIKFKNFNFPKKYKYLIIDEYQDISKQRFELIKNLVTYFSSKVVAVGDDWQSIFGFAGSDVSLFTDFQNILGYGEILKITNTYRNCQELIDVAGEFVSKDNNNIKKFLKSNKHINKPVVIYSYENNVINRAQAVLIAIKDIYEQNKKSSILLIGRYNYDSYFLIKSGLFKQYQGYIVPTEYEYLKLEFTTAHASKGLEYDNVIIINAIDSTYGFPSKVKDDPLFEMFHEKENYAYAEERRLFYVALTRTKNKVYIITPNDKPSPFVLEIKNNLNVEFKDDVIEQYEKLKELYMCPICKNQLIKTQFKPLNQYIYKCSCDDELCNFKTTELKYKYNIKNCPDCDGFLIFKTITRDNKKLIGCTNYKLDNTGCNHIEIL